jgi:carbonic anhydrase
LRFTGYDKTLQSIRLTNNGHSVKFSSSQEKLPTVTGGDLPGHFVFAQGHFHWGNTSHVGSEHLIGGKAFPLELHLVHFNSKYVTIGESLKHADGLAVIGVMHEVSERDNPYLNPIIESLEHIMNAKDQVDLMPGFSLANLLPTHSSAFYRYSGSLTTPGCNEIVTWSVLHHPQAVSEHQLERLRSVLDNEGHPMGDNYRPVMPLHGRRVTVTGLQPTVVITHNVVKGKKEVGAGTAHWRTCVLSLVRARKTHLNNGNLCLQTCIPVYTPSASNR